VFFYPGSAMMVQKSVEVSLEMLVVTGCLPRPKIKKTVQDRRVGGRKSR